MCTEPSNTEYTEDRDLPSQYTRSSHRERGVACEEYEDLQQYHETEYSYKETKGKYWNNENRGMRYGQSQERLFGNDYRDLNNGRQEAERQSHTDYSHREAGLAKSRGAKSRSSFRSARDEGSVGRASSRGSQVSRRSGIRPDIIEGEHPLEIIMRSKGYKSQAREED